MNANVLKENAAARRRGRKFIVGQPMLTIRARGKIEIGPRLRECWFARARGTLLVRWLGTTKCSRNFKESGMPGGGTH